MIQMTLAYIRNAMRSLHVDDAAQDAFEYLLVIGGVSVAVVFAHDDAGRRNDHRRRRRRRLWRHRHRILAHHHG